MHMDYLDEDKPIRGQNYVCLSFISPEDVIRNKEVYYLEKYLEKFAGDTKELFTRLQEKYPADASMFKQIMENHAHLMDGTDLQNDFKFFKSMRSEDIEKEYLEKNNFQTTMRGIKVRGSFETLKEAQMRAELLRKAGDKFDIYVGQVGVWCPWSPNPEDLQHQEYAEEQLNTLMKQYKENLRLKDEYYEQRKQEKLASVLQEKDPWTKKAEEGGGDASGGEPEAENVPL